MPKDIELAPPSSMLENGEMNWGSVCRKDKKSIIVMRKQRDSWWTEASKAPQSHCIGFGKLTSSFWMGNEFLHNLTKSGKWKARIDFKVKGWGGEAHLIG